MFNPPHDFLAAPLAVCLAFLIEVGLKTILAKDNDHKKGHNLWRLFESSNETHKLQIYSNVEIPKEQLEDLIKSHDKVFEEWRYIYELDYRNVN